MTNDRELHQRTLEECQAANRPMYDKIAHALGHFIDIAIEETRKHDLLKGKVVKYGLRRESAAVSSLDGGSNPPLTTQEIRKGMAEEILKELEKARKRLELGQFKIKEDTYEQVGIEVAKDIVKKIAEGKKA